MGEGVGLNIEGLGCSPQGHLRMYLYADALEEIFGHLFIFL